MKVLRIKPWQVAVLVAPMVLIVVFLLIAAGQQIRAWGLNWIWAVVVVLLLGWRWLLARWTRPAFAQAEALVSEVAAELEASTEAATAAYQDALQTAEGKNTTKLSSSGSAANQSAQTETAQVEKALAQILQLAQDDPPVWDDWALFWQRCLSLITAISQVYYPEVKRPLLNIYVPEAYGLIRGTVDDTDRMMQKLTPVLGQVSVGQMVEGVEVYRKLEPSAKKLIKAFGWAQWVLNPAAAIARQTSSKYTDQANQQILLNLSNLLREGTLRNLAQQAVALYGGGAKVALDDLTAATTAATTAAIETKTRSLQEILERAEPIAAIAQKPVSILLVGRTGAGKSSVINTLFQAQKAAVDVLPSTDRIQSYRWQTPAGLGDRGEALTLWDTPGYEQVARGDLRDQVIDHAAEADVLMLITPALDPALQVDADFLQEIRQSVENVPIIAVVSQVDKLRPVREWSPPYHWRDGAWPKETSIREAVNYRVEKLGDLCQQVLPLVTQEDQPEGQPEGKPEGQQNKQRAAWGEDDLSAALMAVLAPAKQLRLARFLRSQTARTTAAATIIDRYSFQMTTTEGLAKLLKSPILQFISTMTTGTPALGAVLTEKIPVEEVPLVLGKLQMAYELFSLLSDESGWQAKGTAGFDLLTLWPLLLKNTGPAADKQAWALGQALVEYWTQSISVNQVEERVAFYLTNP